MFFAILKFDDVTKDCVSNVQNIKDFIMLLLASMIHNFSKAINCSSFAAPESLCFLQFIILTVWGVNNFLPVAITPLGKILN